MVEVRVILPPLRGVVDRRLTAVVLLTFCFLAAVGADLVLEQLVDIHGHPVLLAILNEQHGLVKLVGRSEVLRGDSVGGLTVLDLVSLQHVHEYAARLAPVRGLRVDSDIVDNPTIDLLRLRETQESLRIELVRDSGSEFNFLGEAEALELLRVLGNTLPPAVGPENLRVVVRAADEYLVTGDVVGALRRVVNVNAMELLPE